MRKAFPLMMALLLVLFLLVGCAGLGKIKADDPQSIQALLARVDKCGAEDNWKDYSIPLKGPLPENGQIIYLTVYRVVSTNGYGFGVYNIDGRFALWEYLPSDSAWLMIQPSAAFPIDEKELAEVWTQWVKLLETKGDLAKGFCGIARKTKTPSI